MVPLFMYSITCPNSGRSNVPHLTLSISQHIHETDTSSVMWIEPKVGLYKILLWYGVRQGFINISIWINIFYHFPMYKIVPENRTCPLMTNLEHAVLGEKLAHCLYSLAALINLPISFLVLPRQPLADVSSSSDAKF